MSTATNHETGTHEPVFTGAVRAKLEALFPKYPTKQACLLPALWMVQEARGRRPAEHPGQRDLASGRRKQVLSANDKVDLLVHIVDCHRELVGPVTVAIAQQDVAALLRRRLSDAA